MTFFLSFFSISSVKTTYSQFNFIWFFAIEISCVYPPGFNSLKLKYLELHSNYHHFCEAKLIDVTQNNWLAGMNSGTCSRIIFINRWSRVICASVSTVHISWLLVQMAKKRIYDANHTCLVLGLYTENILYINIPLSLNDIHFLWNGMFLLLVPYDWS